jgi:hypothetical protein
MATEIIPDITMEDLADDAARALVDAAMMYQAAKKHADTRMEVIHIITASMLECVNRGRKIAAEHDPELPASDQVIIHQNMHTMMRTIAAASLALVPLYEILETYWKLEAEHQRLSN